MSSFNEWSINDFLYLCKVVVANPGHAEDFPTGCTCNGHTVEVSKDFFNSVVIDNKVVTLTGTFNYKGKEMEPIEYVAHLLTA